MALGLALDEALELVVSLVQLVQVWSSRTALLGQSSRQYHQIYSALGWSQASEVKP